MSIRTEDAYHDWTERFIRFHNIRHPDTMAEPEVNAFLTHPAVARNVSASTQNQALGALLFLYDAVLGRPLDQLRVARANRPKRLPVVPTCDEVKRVLGPLEGTNGLLGRLLYGTGMRLLECLRLRIKDVDSGLNQITIRGGKGGKDRLTVLPTTLRPVLSEHLIAVKALHESDWAEGFGRVYLPTALERKYPAAAQFRDAPDRIGHGHSDGSGAVGPRERGDDDDLHARSEQGGRGVTSPLDEL